MIIMELNVRWETRMDQARESKMSKYAGLVEECTGNGWKAGLWAVEVACRGFAGFSVKRWIRALGIDGREAKCYVL